MYIHKINPEQVFSKICLITGGTDGIGKALSLSLAHLGHTVVVVARNAKKAMQMIEEYYQNYGGHRIEFLQADLSLMSEVHRIVELFNSKYSHLDLLINNAGSFSNIRRVTSEGFENTFALNYMTPFLLTILLIPALKASMDGRILNMTSVDHKLAKIRFQDLQSQHYPLGTRAYGQSKLALVMFTRSLAEKLKDNSITVNAFHPGILKTKIISKMHGLEGFIAKILLKFVGTPMKICIKNLLTFALSKKYDTLSGEYISKNHIAKCARRARNVQKCQKLWILTEQMLSLNSDKYLHIE
jgi:NAD(P)-dependent dehydrogenase (short-subunit alcohol dehydrogenase family)